MVAPKPVKRQHYVQRAYLELFVSPEKADNGKVWTYDKKGNSPRLQAPINSGLEKNIYTLRHSAAKAPDILETSVFTPIENIGYPIIKKLAATPKAKTLSAEEISHLSGYLAAAHLRVPRNIDATKQHMQALLVESFKRIPKDPEKLKTALKLAQEKYPTDEFSSEENIKNLFENVEKHVKIKADTQVALLLNMQMFTEIGRRLLAMNWSVCDAPNDCFFVVGDSPLTVFASTRIGHAIFGGGFALPQVQIHFPVSPKRCLYLSYTDFPAYLKLTKGMVEEVNRRAIAMSERFVFAPYRSNRIQKLVEKFTGSGIKIDRARVAERVAAWEEEKKSST